MAVVWIVLALFLTPVGLMRNAALADPARAATGLPPFPAAADKAAAGCRDFRNRMVRVVEIPDLGDVGRAEFINGSPVIMFDPAVMASLPANLQLFFSLHECAHHKLGHLFAPTQKSEKEADCWAMQEGRKRHAFTKEDVIAWKPHFAASRGDAYGHLPGPQRIEFLLGCYDEG